MGAVWIFIFQTVILLQEKGLDTTSAVIWDWKRYAAGQISPTAHGGLEGGRGGKPGRPIWWALAPKRRPGQGNQHGQQGDTGQQGHR